MGAIPPITPRRGQTGHPLNSRPLLWMLPLAWPLPRPAAGRSILHQICHQE